MEMIEEDLKTRDIKSIFLQTDTDKPAYGFYQKNGFKELSKHVSFLRGFNEQLWKKSEYYSEHRSQSGIVSGMTD